MKKCCSVYGRYNFFVVSVVVCEGLQPHSILGFQFTWFICICCIFADADEESISQTNESRVWEAEMRYMTGLSVHEKYIDNGRAYIVLYV